MPDWMRLAIGTLTVLRVPAPRTVEPPVAGRAMAAAPLVGLLLALPAGLLVWAVPAVAGNSPLVALLTAALVLGLLAWLTRGLHLDGLADTADGLGSGRAGPDALTIMSRSDIGPFGVATLVLALLLQAVALAVCVGAGLGVVAVVVALVASRASLPLACRRGVPAARPEGLGALVAGQVPVAAAGGAIAVSVALTAGTGWLVGGSAVALLAGLAAVAGLTGSALLVRRCRSRFGGITGDVLGAGVEVAASAAIVVTALGAAWAVAA